MKAKYQILIVDDEEDVHKVLGKMLLKEGYQIQSAFSATDAKEKIQESKPDLIILDIMMPKVSGIELLNELKEDEATKDILVIIVSAKDEQADRIEGLTHGADDYISKPFHLRSLIRKIEHVLTKKQVEGFEFSTSSSSSSSV
jgi:DNA-binding response OmpR family regulator